MKQPLLGSIGPKDEYRYVRLAMANLLNALAKVVHENRNQLVAAVQGFPQEVTLHVFDPVHTSAWYAEECASALDDFVAEDARYEMFEQLEHGCVSVTNLTMLLRALDRSSA